MVRPLDCAGETQPQLQPALHRELAEVEVISIRLVHPGSRWLRRRFLPLPRDVNDYDGNDTGKHGLQHQTVLHDVIAKIRRAPAARANSP
jgi:hypothetical protein